LWAHLDDVCVIVSSCVCCMDSHSASGHVCGHTSNIQRTAETIVSSCALADEWRGMLSARCRLKVPLRRHAQANLDHHEQSQLIHCYISQSPPPTCSLTYPSIHIHTLILLTNASPTRSLHLLYSLRVGNSLQCTYSRRSLHFTSHAHFTSLHFTCSLSQPTRSSSIQLSKLA
jgi:hypothetical protein